MHRVVALRSRPLARATRVRGLPLGCRRFSAAPSEDTPSPKFDRGFEGLCSLYKRVMARVDSFNAYNSGQVFAPDMNLAARMIVFMQLQLPCATEIDAVEFLDGARVAAQQQFEAVNSLDLAKFLVGEMAESASAERLQAFCTPGYYNMVALQVKRSYKQRAFMLECEKMTVETAQLRFVDYMRLTEQQYKEETAFMKHASGSWPTDATLERLRLHVDMATVEDLRIHMLDKDEQRRVQHQSVYRVTFESRVTTPEEVDWRIGNVLRLENRTIEHPTDTDTPI